MEWTRRDFIKSSFLLGSSLLLSPVSLHATQKKEERWIPAYGKLEKEGKLAQRIKQAYAIFENCQLCPRRCGVNRQKGQKGFCRAPLRAVIFSDHPHFGEEMSLVGGGGSGTVFFSKWVAGALSKSTYVNIMAQYRVEYKAFDYPEIARGSLCRNFWRLWIGQKYMA
jgi:uncharacterized Fe-S radical SAM superfamily protein PflX